MMEAEDTVVSREQIQEFIRLHKDEILSTPDAWKEERMIAEAQAEISFKAGYDEAVRFTHRQFDANLPEIMEQSRLLGMREVVEWLNQNCLGCQSNTPCNRNEYLGFHKPSWQAKLKEWGINANG